MNKIERVWLFKDLNDGYVAVFTNLDKADEFVKAYGVKMYDLNGSFPEFDNDYTLIACSNRIDPDVSKVEDIFA